MVITDCAFNNLVIIIIMITTLLNIYSVVMPVDRADINSSLSLWIYSVLIHKVECKQHQLLFMGYMLATF